MAQSPRARPLPELAAASLPLWSLLMNLEDSLVPALFFFTFVAALVIGWVQYRKAKKAQREHHRSASAEANHEPLAASGPSPKGGSDAPR